MAHVPRKSVSRSTHRLQRRATHTNDSFVPVLRGHEAAAEQEQKDAVFGTQNLLEASVTLDKMRLKDEFGSTVLTPSGFEGSWEDYFMTGIKNGSFLDNQDRNPADYGRTVHVPYWTLTNLAGNTLFESDPGSLGMNFTTIGDSGSFTSDPIKIRPGVPIVIGINDRATDAAFTEMTREVWIDEYEADGTLDDQTLVRTDVLTGGGSVPMFITGMVQPQWRAAASGTPTTHIRVRVKVTANTLAVGTASYRCYECDVMVGPLNEGLEGSGSSTLALTTSMQNIPDASIEQLAGWAYLVVGTFDFSVGSSGVGVCTGELVSTVASGDNVHAEKAIWSPASTITGRGTICQVWIVHPSTVNGTMRLRANKSINAGTASAILTNTTIRAIRIGLPVV